MAKLLKGENGYSFKLNELKEWHIFPVNLTIKKCNPLSEVSICGKMDRQEMIEEYNCIPDNKSRVKAAEIGRGICGTCVSHLFKTLDEEDLINTNNK